MKLNSKKNYLVILGLSLVVTAKAQWFSQSILYHSLMVQYQQPGLQTTFTPLIIVRFPGQCLRVDVRVPPLWNQGEDLFMHSKWEDASKIYEACIKLDSSFCDAYVRLGQCFVARNNLPSALRTLQLAQMKFPSNPIVCLGLGQLNLLLEHPEVALVSFNKGISLDSEIVEFYFGSSISLYQTGQNDKALEYLTKGKEKIVAIPDIRAGKTPAYAMDFTRVRQSSSNVNSIFSVYEGILKYKVNQIQASLELLKSVSIEPKDHDVNGLRQYFEGLCFMAQGEKFYPKAKTYIIKAKKSGIAVDPKILEVLGLTLTN